MNDPAIVALTILVGVFVMMIVALVKSGVDGAIRLWGVMGALTGVAFGAISSYYFTKQTKEAEIAQLESQVQTATVAFARVEQDAVQAGKQLAALRSNLTEVGAASPSQRIVLPAAVRSQWISESKDISAHLGRIQTEASQVRAADQQQSTDGG